MTLDEQIQQAKDAGYKGEELEEIKQGMIEVRTIGKFIEQVLARHDDNVGQQQVIFRSTIQTLINSYIMEGLTRKAPRQLLVNDLINLIGSITNIFGIKADFTDESNKAH
jgi:hypothetical protein